MTEETARIDGNDDNVSTQTANDLSNQQQHTFPSAPNTYPLQPVAGVHIAWGVMTKLNSPGTSSVIERFYLDTDLTNYITDVPSESAVVYQYVYSQQALPADIEIHWSIRLDNPSAPAPSMGGWVQAKQHLDGHLSSGNVGSASDIANPLLQAIPSLGKIAKYIPE